MTRPQPPTERPSRTVGPYRLLQLIGDGGMGEVWLAEQTHTVRRQVALKVIKADMDTAHVVARFEAERQALALMDYPAIATVYDGGSTPEGRPYFEMEHVKGEPITTYSIGRRSARQDSPRISGRFATRSLPARVRASRNTARPPPRRRRTVTPSLAGWRSSCVGTSTG